MTELIFVGDMHIGRRPHRLANARFDADAYSPARAWQLVVDAAIARRVDAVVLAGDVVDQSRDRFEAYSHLERGATRLAEAGIALVGVAGNHDGVVLPRLAERLSGFTLLGEGGTWQLLQLRTDAPVDLLGWSFPSRHHRHNPLLQSDLQGALAQRRPDAALLGVLHTDLDGGGQSPYAPVPSTQLANVAADGFFLGHIHKPSALDHKPVGYLGSLVGLHREETGWRGPWLVTVGGRGDVRAERMVLGPVRWELLEVDAADIPDDEGAADALHAAVAEAMRELQAKDERLADPSVSVVACTVEVTGQTASPRRIREAIETLRADPSALFPLGQQSWAVVKWRESTQPRVDLQHIAGHQNAIGKVARLILALQQDDGTQKGGGDRVPAALTQGVRKARMPFAGPTWTHGEDAPALPTADAQLQQAAWQLLETLMQQSEVGQ